MATVFLRGDRQTAGFERRRLPGAPACWALLLVGLSLPLLATSGRSDNAAPPFITLSGHTSDLTDAEFSPDGKLVLTASSDKTAKIWDAHSGALLQTLAGHNAGLKTARFSPDGSRALTASQDTTAKIWDVKTGKLLLTLAGHTDPLEDAEFSRDGKFVVTAARELDRENLERGDRRLDRGSVRPYGTGHAGGFQPRRQAGRDGVRRSYGKSLGCCFGQSGVHSLRP